MLLHGTVRAVASTLGAAYGPSLSIVTFHRILASPDPMFPAEMHAARFARLMDTVAQTFNVLTLRKACALMRSGSLPTRALVLTFDDGYADNETLALPILRRHGLQGTFFVSTGFLDGGRMFNDSVIECVRGCTSVQVDLSFFGLGILPLRSLSERRAAIASLLPIVKYMSLEARALALDRLHAVTGRPELPSNLMMRADQVQALHRAGMEIGAHTVHHPILALLDDDDAQREVAQGRATLQEIISAPVSTMAYPNGRPDTDYQMRHRNTVEALGFEAAVTTSIGVSRPGDDLFQLPRITPWERSDARWLLRLSLAPRHRPFHVAAAERPAIVPAPHCATNS